MTRLQASGFGLRVTLSAAMVVALAAPAMADVKPKEPEKGPDAQGTGGDGPQPPAERRNPLPDIVEKMKAVERRIAETDTGRWSQEEQQRIVEALEIEGGVIAELQKLIEEIESQPPSGSGGASGDQDQKEKRKGGRSKGDQEKNQKERQGGGQEKPVDPQAEQKKESPKDGQRGENEKQDQAKNDRKGEGEQEDPDYKLDRNRGADAGERWGDLPPKKASEVLEAKRREPPPQWKKQIDDYFKRLQRK